MTTIIANAIGIIAAAGAVLAGAAVQGGELRLALIISAFAFAACVVATAVLTMMGFH